MGIGKWIGGAVFDAGREIAARLKLFGRKRTPKEQADGLHPKWTRNHEPNLTTGMCLVCGKPNASDAEHCPGYGGKS